MGSRRVILLLGAVLLAIGIAALFVPVSVTDKNGGSIGCGNALASNLSAAQAADDRSGANVPILNQFIPHTNYVVDCRSSLSTRRAWSIPLAVVGALAVAGAVLVTAAARPRAATQHGE